MDEFCRYRPEAKFGHYLMMAGALGEGAAPPPARQYGEYENSIGTGQVHLWFDRPADGWTGTGLPAHPAPRPPPHAAAADTRGVRHARVPPHPARRRRRPGRPSTVTTSSPADGRRVKTEDASTCPRSCPPRSSPSTSTTAAGSTSSMTDLPPAPDLLPQADLGAQLPPAAPSSAPRAASGSTTRARSPSSSAGPRATSRPAEAGDYIAGYTIANDYGLHDFRDTDAGSMLRVKGSDTLVPARPRPGHRLGLPRQGAAHVRQRRGRPGRYDRRDEVGHALPRRRHRPHHHPLPGRRAAVRHPGQLPARPARRRRRGRGRGPRPAHQPHRHRPRPRSAPTSAPSPPSPRRCCPPRSAATGSSAASARRSDDAPGPVCRSRRAGRVALMSDSSEKPPRQAPQARGLRDRP